MKPRLVFLLALGLVLLGSGVALAAGGYDLSWWTAPGGGGSSSGTGFSLVGAAGQPAAGELSGPGYHLSGGFWVGGEPVLSPTPTRTNTRTATKTVTRTGTPPTATRTSTRTRTGTPPTATRTPTRSLTSKYHVYLPLVGKELAP